MTMFASQWLANPDTGYEIENSLRFNSADSAFLENEDYSGSPTSGTDCTFSFWVKRSKLSSTQCLFFGGDSSGSTWEVIRFESDDQFRVGQASSAYDLITTQVFRDVSSWYHFVVAFDTDNGTAGDRIKIYVNGSRVTDFSLQTNPSSGYVTNFNTGGSGEAIDIGFQGGGSNYCDLYLAEINFIDGQALTPTSFGEFNSTTGQWVPIDTSGLTFGNNGYHLEFKDSSFIGKSTYQRTGNEGMIPQDAGTIIASTNVNFSTSISFDNVTGTNYPTCNQWRIDSGVPATGSFIGKDYGADNTIVATGFKVYPTGDYGFDTWTNASSSSIYSLQLQGSNDGTNYTNIGSATQINGASSATKTSGLSNSTAYRYVRLLITGVSYGGTQQYFAVSEVEFFGVGTYFNAEGISTADQMSDSPTSNHCTLNPLWVDGYTLSDGNLVTNQSGDAAAIGTMAFDPTDSDGFYFEAKVTTAATYPNVGIRTIESCSKVGAVSNLSGNSTGRYSYTGSNGQFNDAGSGSSYGDAWSGTADKVIGVYIKAGELFFSIDGTIQNSGTAAKTGLTGLMVPTVFYDAGSGTQAAWEMRFDASDWSTTPSGYKALSTANLDDPTIVDPSAYFQTTTYTGDGSSSHEINQTGNSTFEPSMVWIKSRSATSNHVIQDQVRGNFVFYPDLANAEGPTGGGWVKSFDSDGFTTDVNGPINASGETFVAWQWKAAGSGSSNTDGSLTATVSADSTSGFSIIKYQGTGSATTVGHGLGVAPKMVIVKDRDNSRSWNVYHDGLSAATKVIYLDQNVAESTDSAIFGSAPTSSVVNIATGNGSNGSGINYVMYAFAEVEGYSAIGSYEGNGSTDGPFIYTGFKPAWVMLKRTDSGGEWEVSDRVRDPDNPVRLILQPNSGAVEWDATTRDIDWLSNGFKHRSSHADFNASGGDYIYVAFAESPFKTATAR